MFGAAAAAGAYNRAQGGVDGSEHKPEAVIDDDVGPDRAVCAVLSRSPHVCATSLFFVAAATCSQQLLSNLEDTIAKKLGGANKLKIGVNKLQLHAQMQKTAEASGSGGGDGTVIPGAQPIGGAQPASLTGLTKSLFGAVAHAAKKVEEVQKVSQGTALVFFLFLSSPSLLIGRVPATDRPQK